MVPRPFADQLVDRINVPIHITGAYQDEQTGPRGPTHLWEQVRGVPKRLILTNGDHNTQNPAYAGRRCGPIARRGSITSWA